MSLYQAFRLVCSAGLLFRRGKSRQKRAGETPAPLRLPNRTPAREMLSGTPSSSSIQTDWTKRGSSPKGAGAFSVHFCAYKSEPVGDKTALRAAAR